MGEQHGDNLETLSALQLACNAIFPLHGPIRPPGEGDWLDMHDEPGQTFEEYCASNPVRPTSQRSTFYVQPLGDFDPSQLRAMELAAEILGLFYGLPVRILERMDLAVIPHHARRPHPYQGEQILSKFVLGLLRRRKPEDAVSLLALTASDLWPGEGWNFVYGQASLRHGVGVWSLYRLGSSAKRPDLFLRRTLKIAVHETGHMFGIRHCIVSDCGMNGANHQEEADRQPLWFCPEDEMKVWWACRIEPEARYRTLARFAETHGLDREARLWRASERAVAGYRPRRGRDL